MRHRSTAAEWMDDPAATEAAFASALHDLARINRLSLAYHPTLRWLDRLVARSGAKRLSVLDVGAGGGDMLREIAAWGARRGVALELCGLDRSPWAGRHAMAAGTPARWITADLFDLDPAEQFDVVLCSLFTHHLRDPELVRFLRWLDNTARRGWLISDLQRSIVPYAFIGLAGKLTNLNPVVIHDGRISVARSLTRAEWRARIHDAGIVDVHIRWMLYRWLISHTKDAKRDAHMVSR